MKTSRLHEVTFCILSLIRWTSASSSGFGSSGVGRFSPEDLTNTEASKTVLFCTYRAGGRLGPGGAANAITVLPVTGGQTSWAGGHGGGGGGLGHTLRAVAVLWYKTHTHIIHTQTHKHKHTTEPRGEGTPGRPRKSKIWKTQSRQDVGVSSWEQMDSRVNEAR